MRTSGDEKIFNKICEEFGKIYLSILMYTVQIMIRDLPDYMKLNQLISFPMEYLTEVHQ